ncbi:hypothetical protein BDV96DRAFT_634186 [Lophiotrema nucula]|uniref:Probable double zinc ribbon domain-containing protein n=1 Tax=Lophiotrema nucula TaxID=690887 RepID=A0A6A5Z0C6_9PLEO|nr:hypothetical protein BDV96DRAFT_634186 [Lophiotrema nucula]
MTYYSSALAVSRDDLSGSLPQRVVDSFHSWIGRHRSLNQHKKERKELDMRKRKENDQYSGVSEEIMEELNILLHRLGDERRNKIYFDDMMACKSMNPKRKNADGVWICKCRHENEILVLEGQFPLGKLKCKLCTRPWNLENPATGVLIPMKTSAYKDSISKFLPLRCCDPQKIHAELYERLTGEPSSYGKIALTGESYGARTPISPIPPGTTPIRMEGIYSSIKYMSREELGYFPYTR